MKKKLSVVILTMILIASTVLVVNDDINVEATSGDGEGANENIMLDVDYIWGRTEQLANVIYRYPQGMIPRGRGFGTLGANNYTVFDILIPELQSMNLSGVDELPIGHIDSEEEWGDWEYTTNIWVNDFQLTVNNDNYPFPNNIPKKESFLIPAGRNSTLPSWLGGVPTFNNSFENVEIFPRIFTDLWPLGGTFNNYSLNISESDYENLNNPFPLIYGKLTYISENDAIPDAENQIGRVFLLEESSSCQDKLDNLTNSQSIIIVDTPAIYNIDASNCPSPVVNIANYSAGSELLNIVENYSYILVDNVTDNLIITYNFNDTGILPSTWRQNSF